MRKLKVNMFDKSTKLEYANLTKLLEVLEEDACGSNDYDREMIAAISAEVDKRNEWFSKNPIPLNEADFKKCMLDNIKSCFEIKNKQVEDFNRALVNTIKNK